MKKTVVLFVLAALVLVSTGLWFFSSKVGFNTLEFLSAAVIILLVGFAVFAGYRRVSSLRKGEPAEDEMSKKVVRSASSLSFYISIYFWLVLSFFSDKIKAETHTIIGAGIMGMAVIFGLCWLVFNFSGVKNE